MSHDDIDADANDDLADGRERRARARDPFKPVPPARDELPPELAALSDEELGGACVILFATAVRILGDRERAKQLYFAVVAKLVTTRRYDPARGPLVPWVLLVVKSEYGNAWRKKAARKRRDAEAHEGFHREQQRLVVASVEDAMLERAEAEGRRSQAAEILEALRVRFADRPLELDVMRLKAEGAGKPADIAAALGVDVHEVYVASRALKDAVAQIHEARAAAGPVQTDEKT